MVMVSRLYILIMLKLLGLSYCIIWMCLNGLATHISLILYQHTLTEFARIFRHTDIYLRLYPRLFSTYKTLLYNTQYNYYAIIYNNNIINSDKLFCCVISLYQETNSIWILSSFIFEYIYIKYSESTTTTTNLIPQ
eukprot:12720_1